MYSLLIQGLIWDSFFSFEHCSLVIRTRNINFLDKHNYVGSWSDIFMFVSLDVSTRRIAVSVVPVHPIIDLHRLMQLYCWLDTKRICIFRRYEYCFEEIELKNVNLTSVMIEGHTKRVFKWMYAYDLTIWIVELLKNALKLLNFVIKCLFCSINI